ncbi:hypothetical protein Angca_001544 [Angiostrongylus cantonensis]|nr:hypothetical protein Angca_001544 [Angiostrongylus cantonensis]
MATVESEVMKTPESAIEYAITNPRILNVSEMFSQESIQALQQSNPPLYRTLEVFSYGTLNDLPKEVDDWASRDTPVHAIPGIVAVLNEFKNSVADVRLKALEDADKRDAQAMADRKRIQQNEADLTAARKALEESLSININAQESSTSIRTKTSRSGKQRPAQATPSNK